MRKYPVLCCLSLILLAPSQIGLASGYIHTAAPQDIGEAGNNPVPSVFQPLIPATAAPGGGGFTLTVNGDGFISTSVVNWNGSGRTTTFLSSHQLLASILSSDIAAAATARITVSNPAPGGGISNVVYFPITTSTSSLVFSQSTLGTGTNPKETATADFNGDGKADIALVNSGSNTVSVFLGNGNGTFGGRLDFGVGVSPRSVIAGDFNDDGRLDLAVSNSSSNTVSILLGNGDGTFQVHQDFAAGTTPTVMAVGDFNKDGKLDLAVANFKSNTVSVLLGNGNGTLQTHVDYTAGTGAGSLTIGDFNGDGAIDLACGNFSANTVSILLGNGNGTFQTHVDYGTGIGPSAVVAADFNGDERLDLALTNLTSNTISILIGNGNGTFQTHVDYGTGSGPQDVATGDLNGDGILDLAIANSKGNSFSTLRGNGNGTFQSHQDNGSFTGPDSIAIADFTGDGRLDVAILNGNSNDLSLFLQIPSASLSPGSLNFGSVNVGSSSAPQNVTLTNTGSAPLSISNISITGLNSSDFSETNGCPGSLAGGSACIISVTFTPQATGSRTATLSVTDNAAGSPQTVSLSGTGAGAPIVSLSPSSLTFGQQQVGTTSPPQNVTLSNIGSATLNITAIAITTDFGQTNNCGSGLAAGASCTISVTFTPSIVGTRTGTLTVTDNAAGSPQSVSLTGTGTSAGNPVPLIAKPLVPAATAPGGPNFTLTVNGTGFVSGAVVNFNAHARTTTFVSSSEVLATILASDIAAAGTASVIVSNPTPGGGNSNTVYFPITAATTSITFGRTDFGVQSGPRDVATGDFNRDGKLDVAVVNLFSNTVSVLMGKGDGTFQPAVNYGTGSGPEAIAVADLNGDNKLDLVVTNTNSNTVSILLGNGDGTFRFHVDYGTNLFPFAVTAADLNGDGKLDLAVAESSSNTLGILIGNGDGSFQHFVDYAVGVNPTGIAAGDFNRDGKLDLALANMNSNTVSILIGNGDGTFRSQVQYASGNATFTVTTEDLNGDGKLDLVTANTGNGSGTTVSVLLGNGDGSFQSHVDYTVGTSPSCAAVADLNGDGKLDLAVSNQNSNTISILLGNGNGTFQTHVDYAAGFQPSFVAAADFNNDGRIDLAVTNNSSNTVSSFVQVAAVSLSPTSVNFGNVNVGSTSPTQTVVLTNTGSATLTISSVSLTGANTGDFADTSFCGSSLPGGVSCSIQVTFTPLATGVRNATLNVTDNASGSPQTVSLTGAGVAPAVSLSPTKLTFATRLVGSSSPVQVATLTNTGNGTLTITSITISGANAADFSETNTCGSSLSAGASCTINVTFKPTAKGTRTASVSVADNASGSPQTVSLTGTGTVVSLSPTSLNFGSVRVGQSSSPRTVTLTNKGSVSLSITNIGITGTNAGDFSETTTCGSSLGAGASCSISVTFTPRATGSRTASLSISDNGGGSPQTVALSGTGT